jgi:hypothetical protein
MQNVARFNDTGQENGLGMDKTSNEFDENQEKNPKDDKKHNPPNFDFPNKRDSEEKESDENSRNHLVVDNYSDNMKSSIDNKELK